MADRIRVACVQLTSSADKAANLEKAELEFVRFSELHGTKLISESQFLESKTTLDVAKANCGPLRMHLHQR